MAAMATWTPLVLAVTLLALVTQGSTVERPLSEESKVVSVLGQISRVLQCSRDVQQSSWRSCEASLGVQQDSLSILQDLQLQRGNSSSSLYHLSEAVASLTQLNIDLSKKLTDKDTKVECLTQETVHLKNQLAEKDNQARDVVEELKTECEAKERKVENLTQENVDLQNQLEAEKVKVENLTQEIVDIQTQLAEKDKVSALSKIGYNNFPGFGFYKLHSQAGTWDDAVQVCRSEGAHLGIVNSVEEAKVYTSIIASQCATNNYRHFHSGFKEIDHTRQFQTLDGVKLSESGYSEWDGGEPNQSHENCGTITRNAKLNDITCSANYPFICELEYK